MESDTIPLNDHEEYMKLAGKWGRYQKIISLIIILTVVHIPLVVLTLPMNQKVPEYKFLNGTDLQYEYRSNSNNSINSICTDYFYSSEFEILKDKIHILETSIYNWAANLKIICKTKRIFSLVGTIYFIASIAGYLALSKFPDRYGRRTIFLILNFFALIAIIQMFFLVNYAQILITAFVLGLGSLNLAIGSVLVNENIDANYSALVIGLSMAMFPLGGIINTMTMYFLRDWRYFNFIVIICLVVTNYLGIKYLRESPKWLMANQKKKEYFETILFIAHINNNYERTLKFIISKRPKFRKKTSLKSDTYNFDNGLTEITSLKEDYRKVVYDVTDLFKYKSIRLLSICNVYLWIMSGFSFYGILLNLEGLTGDIYIDSIVSYSAEFIAEILSGFIADKYGRKPTLLWSFIMATVASLLFSFSFNLYFSITLLFFICIGIASAFNILYIYSAEMYPTNIKSLSVGIFFLFNRISAGIVPFILTLISNVILIIFILSSISVFIMTVLPETLNTDPGDEVKEVVNQIYDKESMISNKNELITFNEIFDESF